MAEDNGVLPRSVNKIPTYVADVETAASDIDKRARLLSEDIENIQNEVSFPDLAVQSDASRMLAARYDYQIKIDDDRYKIADSKRLEEQLQEARASLGIPVHGNNDIARAMKYYMYNRFQGADSNLAFNKAFTYVFFTRPDLNLLNCNGTANANTLSHPESAIMYRRNPWIFKLLTECVRCGDSNNFNMLLSNQCKSFSLNDSQLDTTESGASWDGYRMSYGTMCNSRAAGEFTCTFTELQDYSILNLIRMWMLYIHNARLGQWKPSYNLMSQTDTCSVAANPSPSTSHIFTKTLDYAASAYVFKCGPDGSDILYWTKYGGIIPVSGGENALSWNGEVDDRPNISITFKYMYKVPCSGFSLVEFNEKCARLKGRGNLQAVDPFNENYAHSDRPYTTTPFVEMYLPHHYGNIANGVGVGDTATKTQLRLRFLNTDINGAFNEKAMFSAKR